MYSSWIYSFVCPSLSSFLAFYFFCLVYIRNFSVFLMIRTHLTTFHKICLSSDTRSHECSDWKELRVFLTVVVAWEGTPHSFVGRHQHYREICIRLKDRNYLTSHKTAGVAVAILTRADIWSSKGNRVWKPTSPLSAWADPTVSIDDERLDRFLPPYCEICSSCSGEC